MTTKKEYNARTDTMGKVGGAVWYVLYIVANIFTFASVWFMRNLMTYAIKKSRE